MKNKILPIITFLSFFSSLSIASTSYLGLEMGYFNSQPKDLEVQKDGGNIEIKAFQNFQSEKWSFDTGLGLIYVSSQGSNSTKDVKLQTTALDLNLDAKYKLNDKVSVGPAFKGLFGTDTTFIEDKESDSYFNPFVGLKADYFFGRFSNLLLKGEVGIFTSVSNRNSTMVNFGLAIGFPSKQEKKIEDANQIVVPRSMPTEIVQISKDEKNVTEEVADVKITLKSARVLFNTDISKLDDDLSSKIYKLGVYLSNNPKEWARVKISGHTDLSGGKEYNQQLSQDRANSVMNALVGAGVDPSKVSAIGYGWTRPLDIANTPEAYSKNRRTEIEFFGVKDKESFNKILVKLLK